MTTTPELNELAKDPQAFDTVLARLHSNRDHHVATLNAATAKLHELAGDRKSYRNTRVPVWGMSDNEVTKDAQRKAAHGDPIPTSVLTQRAGFQALVDADDFEIANMDAVYMRQGNRWTRFFPSVTKSHPHIHRSLSCRTLHYDTQMSWAPEMSGRTDAEAVDELDEALCSVCFPDAPVALHNYVSRKSQAERTEREVAKLLAAERKAQTQLTEAEQFKTEGRFGERVTTVAKCKELVRKAIELEVEVEFWATHSPEGWTEEHLARRRQNGASDLLVAQRDAARAASVLTAREAAHEGWGSTAADITRMQEKKYKAARKEWSKV